MPLPTLFRRGLSDREIDRVADRVVARSFSLKNPGPLQKWAADLLGVDESTVSKPYQKSIWVYRAINLWLRVAQVPVLLKDANGEDVTTGPLRFLFDSPNSKMTASQFYELLLLGLALKGEWFVLREDGMNFTGIPKYLTVVWPGNMQLTQSDVKNGEILSWTMSIGGGKTRKIDAAGVIRDMLPNPYDPFRGLSPLESLRMTVDGEYAARKHNKWQMERHGRIGNMVSFTEDIGEETLKAYAKMWTEKYEDAKNAGKTAFLGGGAKFNQLSLSMKDMDWLQGQKLSREEICAAFGIPPNNAGILDKATYSNFEQSTKSLWQDTLMPLGQRMTNRFNKDLVSRNAPGQYLEFDFINNVQALQVDENERVERYVRLVNEGKMTPNQAAMLTQIDLGEPHPAHDIIWITFNEVPAGQAMEAPKPPPEQEPEKSATTTEDGKDGFVPAQNPHETDKAARPLTDELRQARGRSILRQALPWERKLLTVLKRFFWEQRVEVLKNFDKVREQAKDFDARAITQTAQEIVNTLLGGRNWDKELLDKVTPIIRAAGAEAAKRLLQEIKRPIDVFQEQVLDAFVRQQSALMMQVNETTRTALQATSKTLLDGIKAGESPEALLDAMRSDMTGIFNKTEARRRTIARTESLRALNGGRHEQAIAAGVPKKEWLTVRDANVRDTHVGVDGEVKKIDEKYSNGLMYPHDPAGAPGETINCRCTELPVLA